ncbi:2,3-diaminopropionate biosynthesis protein SbnB [Solihabitans fulvus]|uniref:2,3-diaminopropionate biosynthesis protein SbnB n=1 Tax=Solihabitans fulvus TaxID=1892852 RepID=A0A5B2WPP9_9PSEU|nr:2,3-diaminopropionate biosynthesis protein SbnB [Solihabitans fulvus]KAA2253933.1 2,3-diaminopropionate biosynthesis protein SbnB [Solihabitans fulvus]
MFTFDVVGGTVVREIITASRPDIVDVVRQAYLTHHAGDSVNPNSYFLRFPDKPSARIIALPAYLGGEQDVAGIKWIGSFPENVSRNVPRASAVLLLNDYETGYPFACLEASQISAARTAASAVLGAEQLVGGRVAQKIAVVGSGVIARNITEFFAAQQWQIGEVAVFDKVAEYADLLADHVRQNLGVSAGSVGSLDEAIKGADVVVLATTAAEPYITEQDSFAPGQVVLNVSLRDIGPDIITAAHNVLDDIDHCLTANTSPHLAEQATGNREFIDGTLAQLVLGEIALTEDKPKIFSPFGLGVLDLAVGVFVHERAAAQQRTVPIDGFFGETERWSS